MTTEWKPGEPLARGIGETAAQFNALCDYVAIGGRRSIDKLHAAYCVDLPEDRKNDAVNHLLTTSIVKAAIDIWKARGEATPPTYRKATLKSWSVRNDWQKRIDAYVEVTAKREQDEREQRRAEAVAYIEDKGIEHGQLIIEAIDQLLRSAKPGETVNIITRDEHGNPKMEAVELLSVADYIAMMKLRLESDALIRRAVGLPDKYTQTRLADHEGGPASYNIATIEVVRPQDAEN